MNKRNKDNDFGNLPKSAQDFIKLIIKKMRYRKSVRRDVQAELTAHFEDELHNYTDEQQKDRKAKELIEQFGDATLLGILLRRAKKRCRPLWRTIVARTFQTILVLITCFILYVAWFMTGKPAITTDYLAIINAKNRPAFPAADNAWPVYQKAFDLYVEPNEALKRTEGFKNYRYYRDFTKLTEEGKILLKNWINQNELAWEFFVSAGKKPYRYKNVGYGESNNEKWLINILLPELQTLRGLAIIGLWKARMLVFEKNYEKAYELCLTLVRTGKHWQSDRFSIIEQLVGASISSLGHSELLNILTRTEPDARKLKYLQESLHDIYPQGYLLVEFQVESFFIKDIVQHVFTQGGLGGGHLIPERLEYLAELLHGSSEKLEIENIYFLGALDWTRLAMSHARRNETMAKAEKIRIKIDQIQRMTPYQSNQAGKSIDQIYEALPNKYFFLKLFPYSHRTCRVSYQHKAEYDATFTALALLRYKVGKGELPESLQSLVKADYLEKVPIDPYSDKPLVYYKQNDDFILYSVGQNFIDDGGQVNRDDDGRVRLWDDEEGDAVFWPVQK